MGRKIDSGNIFLIILLVNIGFMVYFYNVNQGYWWDEAVYLGLAQNLNDGKGYWINVPGQEAFRPPLFPWITASMFSLGFTEPTVKALPPLFAVLSVIVIYYMSREMFGNEIAILAALILSTSHFFLFYSEKFLTESMFVLLSLLTIYTYYLGVSKGKRYMLPLSGIFLGLSFLTRYLGIIFLAVYLLYPLLMQKEGRKKWSRFGKSYLSPHFWIGLGLFLLVLIPWFMNNLLVFGSPAGALFVGFGTVTENWFIAEWHYYVGHWIEFFGLVGVFAIPGLVSLVLKRGNPNMLMLLIVMLTILAFMAIPRKETRYLLHYIHIYAIMIGMGVYSLRKWVHSSWFIPLLAVIFVSLNFLAGMQMIQGDVNAGSGLKSAGYWIRERIPEGAIVMSQNVPVLFYTANRQIVYFPQEEGDLHSAIEEYNVSYIVIEAGEPTYPGYVWTIDNYTKTPSGVFSGFVLEQVYEEFGKPFVWVYRIR